MNQLYINQITFCFTMSYKTARFKLLYVVVMLGDIHLQDAAEVWMVAGYWSHSWLVLQSHGPRSWQWPFRATIGGWSGALEKENLQNSCTSTLRIALPHYFTFLSRAELSFEIFELIFSWFNVDPTEVNPYLLPAMMLACGFWGIDTKLIRESAASQLTWTCTTGPQPVCGSRFQPD